MRRFLLAAAVLALFAAPFTIAYAQQSTAPTMKPEEGQDASPSAQSEKPTNARQFVRRAGVAGLWEIETSRLALEKAQRAEVKQFAQRMIDDHTKIGDELKAAVEKAGGRLAVPDSIAGPQQKTLDRLKGLSGRRFDRMYVRLQARAHDQAVKLFSAYAETGDNEALQQFAKATLPMLQAHLQAVQALDQGRPASGRRPRGQTPEQPS